MDSIGASMFQKLGGGSVCIGSLGPQRGARAEPWQGVVPEKPAGVNRNESTIFLNFATDSIYRFCMFNTIDRA